MKSLRLTLLTLFICGSFPLQAMAETNLSVYPLEVYSLNPEEQKLGNYISENITDALKFIPEFNFASAVQQKALMEKLNFNNASFSELNNVIRFAKYLSLDLALTGSLELNKNEYKINLKYIDIKNGKIVRSSSFKDSDLFALLDKISLEIVNHNKIKINQAMKNQMLLLSGGTDNHEAFKEYYKGKETYTAYNAKAYQEALKSFDKALTLDNKYIQVIAEKAKVQAFLAHQLKQDKIVSYKDLYAQSLENLKKTSNNPAFFVQNSKSQAMIYFIQEEYDKGKSEIQKVLKKYPDDLEANYIYWLNKGAASDDKLVEIILKQNPDFPLIHEKLAYSFFNEGKLDESIKEYQTVLSISPKNASANFNLAEIYFKTGRFAEAIKYYNKTLEISPSFWQAFMGIALSQKYQDKLESAVESFKKAIKLHNNIPNAYMELGEIYLEMGEPEKAVAEYNNAIKFNPENYEAHYYIGTIYKYQDKSDEAIKEYLNAIRINPDFAEAHYNLGIAYKQISNLISAIEEYKKAIKINPEFSEAYLNLGAIYSEQNNYEDAINMYKEAIRLKPDYARAYNNLGTVYFKSGKFEEAVKQYKEAIKINVNYSSAYYNLAVLFQEQKKTKEAEANYKKACSLGYLPACN